MLAKGEVSIVPQLLNRALYLRDRGILLYCLSLLRAGSSHAALGPCNCRWCPIFLPLPIQRPNSNGERDLKEACRQMGRFGRAGSSGLICRGTIHNRCHFAQMSLRTTLGLGVFLGAILYALHCAPAGGLTNLFPCWPVAVRVSWWGQSAENRRLAPTGTLCVLPSQRTSGVVQRCSSGAVSLQFGRPSRIWTTVLSRLYLFLPAHRTGTGQPLRAWEIGAAQH
jgi:hypothetical protein